MSLYTKIIDLQKLHVAWEHVRKNKPAAGVDRVTYDAFDANIREELQQLRTELTEHRYECQPVRMVTIYKEQKAREIALFCMRDKVVQQSIASELAKKYEPFFAASTYAYRPGRSALEAVAQIEAAVTRYQWVLKSDITHFFDNIDRGKLLQMVGQRIVEQDVLELIRTGIEVRRLDRDGTLSVADRGVLQGSSISPVLSNIYLVEFDRNMESAAPFYIRYADDILILGNDREQLGALYEQMQNRMGLLGLELNQEKTTFTSVESGFEFLGYGFDRNGRQITAKAEAGLTERLESMWFTCGRMQLREKLQKGAEILGGWEQYYRKERRPGSILEYAVAFYMACSKNEEAVRELIELRPQYENTYSDLSEFFLSIWKKLGRQSYLALEYEQLLQIPDVDPSVNMCANEVLFQELLAALDHLKAVEDEDSYTQLIQIYSDLGCYNKAAFVQDRRTAFTEKHRKVQLPVRVSEEELNADQIRFSPEDIQNYMVRLVGREDMYSREVLEYGGRRKFEPVTEPLTEDVVEKHLVGELVAGTYIQRPNLTAHFMVIDVDISKKVLLQWQNQPEMLQKYLQMAAEHAGILQKKMEQLGLSTYIEFSGYRGYHLWLFFSEWLPVRYIHMLEDVVEAKYQSDRCEEISIEFFPGKMKVRPGTPGQSIKLPYAVHSKTGKRSCFLSNDFLPVADVSAYLKDIACFSLSTVKKILSANLAQSEANELAKPIREEAETDLTGFGELADCVRVVLENCNLVRYLCQKARRTGYLPHGERLSILYVFGHLGDDGKEFVHRIMSYTLNYQYNTTEKFIRKLPEKPISCIKLREQYKTLTAEYGCSCTFKRNKNCYPSPVLHAIRKADAEAHEVTIPTSRTLTKEKEKTVFEEINIHKKVQDIATKVLELKKQRRSLDRSIEKLEKEMEDAFDSAGIDCLEIEMGLLTRRKTEQGYEWIIQI